ncbi:TPA: bifunctional methylenetetrahydrofolate dehydrogenase/methenyltetrahydrofolate cyclohydrolase FolD [Candidatus Galligastranaerophilus gallistercoris]|nr:bifunctional methylenetetrahydrofolate dehydrogenase/methenyltetrahydrofolate cyclohydrolase FolD [Candidatus Galligastranaerophilus gallistercoris]
MAIILDGKQTAKKITDELKLKVQNLDKKPSLAVIMAGNNPASEVYVKNKEKKALEIGFNSIIKKTDENITKEELLKIIKELNEDDNINAILLQLPLPKHLNEKDFLDKIDPKKDVDGFCSYNLGKLLKNDSPYAIPCTPKGIIRLLDEYNIDIESKIALVIGRSNIVGKPVSILLLNRNSTVIMTHTKTKNLENLTKTADILICAAGKKEMIKKEMIKENAVIIDVGITRDNDGKLKGDVDFNDVKEKTSYITPVPGGIGPMTIAMLMENTYELYKIQKGIK